MLVKLAVDKLNSNQNSKRRPTSVKPRPFNIEHLTSDNSKEERQPIPSTSSIILPTQLNAPQITQSKSRAKVL